MVVHAEFASSDSQTVFLSSLLHHLTLGEILRKRGGEEGEQEEKFSGENKNCFS